MLFIGQSSSIKRLATAHRLWTRTLAIIGIASLASITLSSPAATRMFSSGWREAAAIAYLAPLAILLLRSFSRDAPLILPPRPWLAAALAWTLVVLLSAALSPYRSSAFLWSPPLLSAVAVFLVVYDFVAPSVSKAIRVRSVATGAALFLTAVALTSLGLWLVDLPGNIAAGNVFGARNPYPLGHSNYTAGIALLLLPCAAILAARSHGTARVGWIFSSLASLALLFTSGSRGGFVGLAVLAVFSLPAIARLLRIRLGIAVLAAAAALIVVVATNPRLRSLVGSGIDVSSSDDQRAAMLEAGLRLGAARPLLGWGAGTTPLAYSTVRPLLDGGPDTVLQVHSTPVELWAEFGAAGVLVGLFALVLLIRGGRTIAIASVGYLVFCLTDWQFDVPLFAYCAALGAALCSGEREQADASLTLGATRFPYFVGALAIAAFALVALLGRRDPAPELNARALAMANDPARKTEAVALLEQSLALNPDQEIAHFNLGWLQVVSDPAQARIHFRRAAELVPNKRGAHLGQGLAELNDGQPKAAALCFALEGLNDPLFLSSPWWKLAPIAALREPTEAALQSFAAELRTIPDVDPRVIAEARYVAALAEWLSGRRSSAQMLGFAETTERVGFFSERPPLPAFNEAKASFYRRERTGYPVLMRNLDVPVPRDLFDVQENSLAAGEFSFLFPRPGWIPAPLLTRLHR